MYFFQYFLFWKSMFCKLFFNNFLLIWSVVLFLIICLRISILKISHHDLHVWSVMSLKRTCSQRCPTYYLSIESKSAFKLSKYNCKSLTATGMWNPGNVEESSVAWRRLMWTLVLACWTAGFGPCVCDCMPSVDQVSSSALSLSLSLSLAAYPCEHLGRQFVCTLLSVLLWLQVSCSLWTVYVVMCLWIFLCFCL